MLAIDIVTYITVSENKEVVLSCTKDRFNGKHEWSRKDREPAITNTRILTNDTRLAITDASVEDAGEYICRNGETVTHRFVVTVEGRPELVIISPLIKPTTICKNVLTLRRKTEFFQNKIAASDTSVRYNTRLIPPLHSKPFSSQVLSVVSYCHQL